MMSGRDGEIKSCELAKLSSWRIGGTASCFHEVHSLPVLVNLLRAFPYQVVPIGGLSNLLINDQGVDERFLLVHFGRFFSRVKYLRHKGWIYAEAGARLGAVVSFALQQGMVDAIFLVGIPGTVGGAVRMNAGAHGSELWQHLVALKIVHRTGKCRWYWASQFKPGYREVEGLAADDLVVAVMLHFEQGDVEAARQLMREQIKRRRATQPLEFASCGSVFRNPPGDYAARLIEQCGLKGYRIGGAEVSTKHANFIVNRGGATSHEVLQLISLIKQKVKERYNVELQLEIKLLGLLEQ